MVHIQASEQHFSPPYHVCTCCWCCWEATHKTQQAVSALLIFVPPEAWPWSLASNKIARGCKDCPDQVSPMRQQKQKQTKNMFSQTLCCIIVTHLSPLQENDGLWPDRFLPARLGLQQHLPQHQVWCVDEQQAASSRDLSATQLAVFGSGACWGTAAYCDR